MVGKIGRQIKNLSNGTLIIPRIYALDPAGKLQFFIDFFLQNLFQVPVSKISRLKTRCRLQELTPLTFKSFTLIAEGLECEAGLGRSTFIQMEVQIIPVADKRRTHPCSSSTWSNAITPGPGTFISSR